MIKLFDSARHELQNVNSLIDAKISTTNPGIAYKSTQSGVLGDDTIFITICYTNPADWPNRIFENSNYVRFMVDKDGTVESHVTSVYLPNVSCSYETRLPVKKFRKCKAKTLPDAINKIMEYSVNIEKYYI